MAVTSEQVAIRDINQRGHDQFGPAHRTVTQFIWQTNPGRPDSIISNGAIFCPNCGASPLNYQQVSNGTWEAITPCPSP